MNTSKLHIINDEYIIAEAEQYASKKHHKAVRTKQGMVVSIKWLRVRETYIDAYKRAVSDIGVLSGLKIEQ